MTTKILHIALIMIFSLSTLNASADEKRTLMQNKAKAVAIMNLISFEKAEADLEMEYWMTSYKEFNHSIDSNFDSELYFENWMVRDFSLDQANQEMTFESWMMQPFEINEDSGFDEELNFEWWMLKF